jgi:hypothetical protein
VEESYGPVPGFPRGALPHAGSHPSSCSLDLFFRWLFDKKFLAEAAIRFE